MRARTVLFILAVLAAGTGRLYAADIPYLTGRVNDNAGILTEDTRNSLGRLLKAHELKTTNQVVILTTPSLEGESIEDYANKVFNEWGLGQKGRDNGILIVIIPEEKRMRIEVGYGLEWLMPDVLAGRIIRNVIAPRFREGNFDLGITEGTKAVISALEGETATIPEDAVEEPAGTQSMDLSNMEVSMPLGQRILIGAFIFGIIGLFTVLGIMTPGVGWFLYIFLIPFWAMFPVIVVGTKGALVLLIIYVIGYPAAKFYLRNKSWYKKARYDLKTKGRASIGGFTLSSGGSGSSWSSGGSSGGFSGGGGSSGGGGASGGW